MYTHSWGNETLPFQNGYRKSNSAFPTCGVSKNHLGREERERKKKKKQLLVAACMLRTVESVLVKLELTSSWALCSWQELVPPPASVGRPPSSTACRIYSRQTINQHQAINLAFEPSLKPIKAHSCQMEFILISFQSQ